MLPTVPHFRVCSATDTGRRRAMNQDMVLTDRELELFVIADGMGGHQHGDIASRIVVDAIRQFVQETAIDEEKTWPFEFDVHLSYTANRLKNAVLVANRRLGQHADSGSSRGMGATLTAVLFGSGRRVIANVGDCRTYLVNADGLRQLTRDHSWVAEQVESGFITAENARVHPWRHMVTRAVQGESELVVDTVELDAADDCRLLLCSDGLHGTVPDDRIISILSAASSDLADACRALIQAANDNGGPDNISVILIDCFGTADSPEHRVPSGH
jgi:protein phosphatase